MATNHKISPDLIIIIAVVGIFKGLFSPPTPTDNNKVRRKGTRVRAAITISDLLVDRPSMLEKSAPSRAVKREK
eukprot:scaffold239969_cov26-Tisochrysis_lutea.AAC.3